MLNPITAVYEKGVLRPLTPLALPEETQVQIYVQPISAPSEALAHRRRVHEALTKAGLSLSLPPVSPSPSSISAERRAELAQIFSAGRPLSDLIIEEREGR
jgi:predicted DNA-binding antitoxin AbrB/MazE fold protein